MQGVVFKVVALALVTASCGGSVGHGAEGTGSSGGAGGSSDGGRTGSDGGPGSPPVAIADGATDGGQEDSPASDAVDGADRTETGAGGLLIPTPPPADPAGIPPGPQLCGGVECPANEACCLLDLTCFDPVSEPEGCVPATEPTGRDAYCTSNADCEPTEMCRLVSMDVCTGIGECAPKTNCSWCLASDCLACGCDGKRYPDRQTACLAGVNVLMGDCGTAISPTLTRCGTTEHCPAGEVCCSITGTCFDPAVPELCRLPPEGTRFPCITDDQCVAGEEFCAGVGCQGPGGCASSDAFTCEGPLEPVCGCDGNSYMNQQCAFGAGVRIASSGMCP